MLGWDREPVIVPSERACGSGNGRLGNRDAGEARTPGQTARRRGKSRDSRMLDWDAPARLTPFPFPASRQSSARSIPPAKSGLRRGGITRPTRRHVLMALFSTPPSYDISRVTRH